GRAIPEAGLSVCRAAQSLPYRRRRRARRHRSGPQDRPRLRVRLEPVPRASRRRLLATLVPLRAASAGDFQDRLSKVRLRLDTTLELVAHSCADTIYCVARGKCPLAPVSPPSRSRAGEPEKKEERYMQIAAELTPSQSLSGTTPLAETAPEAGSAYAQY